MEVRVENLSMQFDSGERQVRVFSGLNFSVESGSSVAVLGPSGVGKTTMLYNLAGIETPTSGDIHIGGFDLGGALRRGEDVFAFRGENIGMVFQFHYLLGEFDAVENVAMPLIVQGVARPQAKEQAEALLERVGLGHRLTHRPGTLSGGEQQRVAIARALISRPGLILADEPTGNLDSENGDAVISLLQEIQRDFGATLIMVTHSRQMAEKLDRSLTMSATGVTEGAI